MKKKRNLGDTYVCATSGYVFECVRGHSIKFGRDWVAQHIVRMAEKLGRALYKGEMVHHANENKQDNSDENLILTTRSVHADLHRRHPVGSSFGVRYK